MTLIPKIKKNNSKNQKNKFQKSIQLFTGIKKKIFRKLNKLQKPN